MDPFLQKYQQSFALYPYKEKKKKKLKLFQENHFFKQAGEKEK